MSGTGDIWEHRLAACCDDDPATGEIVLTVDRP